MLLFFRMAKSGFLTARLICLYSVIVGKVFSSSEIFKTYSEYNDILTSYSDMLYLSVLKKLSCQIPSYDTAYFIEEGLLKK